MAQQVPITGAGASAKIRSPIWVPVLVLVTIGIYGIFWWYFIHRELRDYGRAKGTDELGTSPGKSVLAVTLGALIIVPAIIGIVNAFRRVQAARCPLPPVPRRPSGLPLGVAQHQQHAAGP
jgi:hypothetical protein